VRVCGIALGAEDGLEASAVGDGKGDVITIVVVVVESLFASDQKVEEALDEMLLVDVLGFSICQTQSHKGLGSDVLTIVLAPRPLISKQHNHWIVAIRRVVPVIPLDNLGHARCRPRAGIVWQNVRDVTLVHLGHSLNGSGTKSEMLGTCAAATCWSAAVLVAPVTVENGTAAVVATV
jgi:hypothetical protein